MHYYVDNALAYSTVHYSAVAVSMSSMNPLAAPARDRKQREDHKSSAHKKLWHWGQKLTSFLGTRESFALAKFFQFTLP